MSDAGVAWHALAEWLVAAGARIGSEAPDAATQAEGMAYLGRFAASGLARALNPAARTIGGLYFSDHLMGGRTRTIASARP